jgi:hypothetical protein
MRTSWNAWPRNNLLWRRRQRLELRDRPVNSQPNALLELAQLDQVVRQEDQYRVVVGIRLRAQQVEMPLQSPKPLQFTVETA